MATASTEIPRLVEEWSAGSQEAFDSLVTLLYDDLRELARAHIRREQAGHTLDTTALVHEAYLHLAERTGPDWRGRPRLFAFVSKVMRHILVDHARRKGAAKRGGEAVRVEFRDEAVEADGGEVDLLALDEALDRLAEKDAQLASVVECRFFGGLTANETAESLGISLRTVERHWHRARAYLYHMLNPQAGEAE